MKTIFYDREMKYFETISLLSIFQFEWTMKHLSPCVCNMWYLFFHNGMYFTTTLAATWYLFYHHGIMYFTTTTIVSILSITSPLKKRVGICRENIGCLWWELRLLFKSNPLKLFGHFRSIWSNLIYVLCSNLILRNFLNISDQFYQTDQIFINSIMCKISFSETTSLDFVVPLKDNHSWTKT